MSALRRRCLLNSITIQAILLTFNPSHLHDLFIYYFKVWEKKKKKEICTFSQPFFHFFGGVTISLHKRLVILVGLTILRNNSLKKRTYHRIIQGVYFEYQTEHYSSFAGLFRRANDREIIVLIHFKQLIWPSKHLN